MFAVKIFAVKMFADSGESKKEIYEYNTTTVRLQNLGKFTNSFEKLYKISWIYKQYSKLCLVIEYHYFRFSTTPKHILKNSSKNHLVKISHYQSPCPKGACRITWDTLVSVHSTKVNLDVCQ